MGKCSFPLQKEGQSCSHPHFMCGGSTPPGENTEHRQSDTSMEHQGQNQIICHQIICHQISCHQTLKPGTRCPTTGVPHPGPVGDSSAPPQFLAEPGKSKPRAPRVALNPSHFASIQILPQFPHQDNEDEHNTRVGAQGSEGLAFHSKAWGEAPG